MLFIVLKIDNFAKIICKHIGNNINGVGNGDQCGYSVSCSSDGYIIASASISHENYKCHVRVYKKNGGICFKWAKI